MPKILIIEDDTAFCQMLQKFLIKNGFAVSTSHSIKEAEDRLSTSSFDVILSDVRLPKGSGVTFLPQVKRDSPTTQVILMTGYAEVKTAVSAMKRGAFDYISKPFTPEEILTVINNALNTALPEQKTPKKPEANSTKPEQNNF